MKKQYFIVMLLASICFFTSCKDKVSEDLVKLSQDFSKEYNKLKWKDFPSFANQQAKDILQKMTVDNNEVIQKLTTEYTKLNPNADAQEAKNAVALKIIAYTYKTDKNYYDSKHSELPKTITITPVLEKVGNSILKDIESLDGEPMIKLAKAYEDSYKKYLNENITEINQAYSYSVDKFNKDVLKYVNDKNPLIFDAIVLHSMIENPNTVINSISVDKASMEKYFETFDFMNK